MNPRISTIFLALMLVLLMQMPTFAQQVNITAQLTNPSIRVFMLSDFNFTGAGSTSGEIFALAINNSSPQAENCKLEMFIRSQSKGELAFGGTNAFVVQPGTERITNQNLFTKVGQFQLENYNVEQSGDDLLRAILATGKLPSDIYFFEFVLTQLRTNHVSNAIITIDITNPSTLDLIAPGSGADNSELTQIFTTLPLFRWQSDMQVFRLIVAEKIAGVHDSSSPQEIIQDRIRLDKKLTTNPAGANGAEIIPATAYQYPASGTWPLEPGKTYYWQIIGIVESSGAPVELPSEIWAFQINDVQGSLLSPEQQLLLDQLNITLSEMLQGCLGPGGGLSGFTPTGVIMINHRPATIDELQAIMTKIRSGEFEVKNARCE